MGADREATANQDRFLRIAIGAWLFVVVTVSACAGDQDTSGLPAAAFVLTVLLICLATLALAGMAWTLAALWKGRP